jgi:hypothetical protein
MGTFSTSDLRFFGGPDSYTISGQRRHLACPTGTKGRSGRKRQFPKLSNLLRRAMKVARPAFSGDGGVR